MRKAGSPGVVSGAATVVGVGVGVSVAGTGVGVSVGATCVGVAVGSDVGVAIDASLPMDKKL